MVAEDVGILPQSLIDRGFVGRERYIHPWVAVRVFREDDLRQSGLSIVVWNSFNHGNSGEIFVQVQSAECEATATVAMSFDLEQLLPTIDGLIAICLAAPYVEAQ